MSLNFAVTAVSFGVLALAAGWLVFRFGKKLGDWLEDQQWKL